MNTLASRFPGLNASLPLHALTDLPTPLEPADGLAHEIGAGRLLIKRDDLTAHPHGGNKVRKLEYLLGDALYRGCDTVVTFGAAGSNHALATAVYARQLGLTCYAVLTDQPLTSDVGPTLRYHARLGTILVHADGYLDSLHKAEGIRNRHPGGAARLYEIAWGGSSWLGATAFVNAALELSAQLGERAEPHFIYVACGTMGTAVGLALGLRLAEMQTRVVAVQVVPEPVTTAANFEKLFERTNRELHDRESTIPIFENPLANVELRAEFLGPGYAEATPECAAAIKLIKAAEGLRLETTYTGKALAALVHDARSGRLEADRALFWNTYNSLPYPANPIAVGPTAFGEAFRKYL